jgi:dTDP-4-dehydrorhamnose reductase
MYLLIGGDSELGAATYRYFKANGLNVQATTRRRALVSPERPFFEILHSLDEWTIDPGPEAACIFLSVARLRDCAADPVGSAKVNVGQTLRLVDKLIAKGTYVLFLSSNQVFDGEVPHVLADTAPCPVSEYGRQKAETEAAIRERIAKGAPVAILRLSKVFASNNQLIEEWIQTLLSGKPIQAFDDMTVAPIPVDHVIDAISALLKNKLSGIYQLTGPHDVAYSEIGRYLATELGANPELVEPISAYSIGMPKGSTPRHTTLDNGSLREKFGIIVPDVWKSLSPMLEAGRIKFAHQQLPGAKLIGLDDLSEVADGIYYSRYPLPLIDAEVVTFLKEAAAKSPLRRARFCAHLSPDAEQHDMLIVSHRDTYVTPHRHLKKSETFVLLEGSAEIILFDESGAVEKIVKMGTPASGRPFFYRMPARQFHSLSIESELLVFLENTKGPFSLSDREHASWAPDYKDTENGKAFIASILQRANRIE